MSDHHDTDQAAAARTVLAGWLAQHSLAPDSWTADGLRHWNCVPREEWLAFTPPFPGNQVYLVNEQTVFDYAPSQLGPADALAAARAAKAKS
jgi:hypothetical protein